MSTTQPSNMSSPISSGMPSPTFSVNSGKDVFGKAVLPMEKSAPLRLPPPATMVMR
jgi:hypothetical protein